MAASSTLVSGLHGRNEVQHEDAHIIPSAAGCQGVPLSVVRSSLVKQQSNIRPHCHAMHAARCPCNSLVPPAPPAPALAPVPRFGLGNRVRLQNVYYVTVMWAPETA